MPTKKGIRKEPIKRNLAATRKAEAAAKRQAEKETVTTTGLAQNVTDPTKDPKGNPLPDVTIEVKTLPGADTIAKRISEGRKAIQAASQRAATAEAEAKAANANLNAARTAVAGEQKSLLSTVGVMAEMSGKLDSKKQYTTIPSQDGQLILCYESKPQATK